MKKIYTIDVPYYAVVSVRVETDSIMDNSDALDKAMDALDDIGSLLMFVDDSGSQIDPELISIQTGRYTETLSISDNREPLTVSWEEDTNDEGMKGSVLHLDAGSDRNGNPRRCFVVFSSSGQIIDAIDEGYYGFKAYDKLYPKYVYLGRFKTSFSEYRQILKAHSKQLS